MAHEGPTTSERAGQAASPPWTVRKLLGWILSFLKDRDVDSPRTIAEILLSEVLQVGRLGLYLEPERELTPEELGRLRDLVARAGRHEPVQFLVGSWRFFGRDFEVAPCTLIPRPSTETLVERALDWYRSRGGDSARVLDLCTGSGCIAISLALGMRAILRPGGGGCKPLAAGRSGGGDSAGRNASTEVMGLGPSGVGGGSSSEAADGEPDRLDARVVAAAREGADGEALSAAPSPAGKIHVVATDIVPQAVELAMRNASKLAAMVEFRGGDLWEPIGSAERFDLIVSNPPYVTDLEYQSLDRNVREFEPAIALRGGLDGLDVVRRIVQRAPGHLADDGMLAIEIGWKHREAALELVAGPIWKEAEVLRDHEGIDRVLVARRCARG